MERKIIDVLRIIVDLVRESENKVARLEERLTKLEAESKYVNFSKLIQSQREKELNEALNELVEEEGGSEEESGDSTESVEEVSSNSYPETGTEPELEPAPLTSHLVANHIIYDEALVVPIVKESSTPNNSFIFKNLLLAPIANRQETIDTIPDFPTAPSETELNFSEIFRPQVPEAQDLKEIPQDPEVPEIPQEPEVPEVPLVPEIQKEQEPQATSVPEVREEQQEQDLKEKVPEAPLAPEAPVVPVIPADPVLLEKKKERILQKFHTKFMEKYICEGENSSITLNKLTTLINQVKPLVMDPMTEREVMHLFFPGLWKQAGMSYICQGFHISWSKRQKSE